MNNESSLLSSQSDVVNRNKAAEPNVELPIPASSVHLKRRRFFCSSTVILFPFLEGEGEDAKRRNEGGIAPKQNTMKMVSVKEGMAP